MHSGSSALLCVRFTGTKIDAHVCNYAQCHEHACILVWLARPSHLNAGSLGLGRDGLAAVAISSHLFN